MTNEELAQSIQEGRKELTALLWSQTKAWIYTRAIRFYEMLGDNHRGLTVEDLTQAGFLAVLDAADHYDPAKGAFISLLTWYAENQFRQAAGMRTEKQLQDPVNSRTSLNQPANDDEGTLMDLQADPADPIGNVIDRLYNAQLEKDIQAALSRLPEQEAYILREHYLKGRGLKAIAAEMEITPGKLQTKEKNGLRKMRRDEKLRTYIDEITNYYYRTNYKISFISPVEALAEMRERWRENL